MIDEDLLLEAARLYDPAIDANVREVYELLQDHQLITFTTAPEAALSFSGVSLGPAVPITYANDGNIYIRNTYTGAGTTGPFAFSQGYTVGVS